MFTLIRFEIKRSWKLVVAWSTAWLGYIFLLLVFFDDVKLATDELENLYKAFPEGLLEAFSASPDMLTKLTHFINAEFISMFVLANTILATYLGARALAGEIKNHSIAQLLSRPVSRMQVFFGKFLALASTLALINTLVTVGAILITQLILPNEEINLWFYPLVFSTIWLMELAFAALGILVSITSNTTLAIGVGALAAVGGLFINGLAAIEGTPDNLKYLSPNHYLSLQHIAENIEVKFPEMWMFIAVTSLFLLMGAWWFQRRDINV